MDSAKARLFSGIPKLKKDTNYALSWIVEQAELCGALQKTPVEATNGKQGKDLKKVPLPSVATLPYVADQIVNTEPPIEVPEAVVDALESAIAKRREISEWYEHAFKGDPMENQTHRHFIQVLQRVLDIFAPKSKRSQPDRRQQKRTWSKLAPLQSERNRNAFENLEVFDVPDHLVYMEHSEAPVNRRHSQTQNPILPEERKVKHAPLDFVLMIMCFLKELHDLIDYIKLVWQQSFLESAGDDDWTKAALLTNICIATARDGERKLFAALKRQYDNSDTIGHIIIEMMLQHGAESSALGSSTLSWDKHLSLESCECSEVGCPIAEVFMWNTLSTLACFSHIELKPESTIKSGALLRSEQRAPKQACGSRWRNNSAALHSILNTLAQAGEGAPDFGLDEVGYAIKTILGGCDHTLNADNRTSAINLPYWTVFALHTLMTVRECLGEKMATLRDKTYITLNKKKESYQWAIPFAEHLFPSYKKNMEDAHEKINIMLGICTSEDNDSLPTAERNELKQLVAAQKLRDILNENPIRCGILRFYVAREWARIGVSIVDQNGVTVLMAHLYNLYIHLREYESDLENLGGFQWQTMETFLLRQEKKLFYEKRPSTIREIQSRALLATGARASRLSRAMQGGCCLKSIFKNSFRELAKLPLLEVPYAEDPKTEVSIDHFIRVAGRSRDKRNRAEQTTRSSLTQLIDITLFIANEWPATFAKYTELYISSLVGLEMIFKGQQVSRLPSLGPVALELFGIGGGEYQRLWRGKLETNPVRVGVDMISLIIEAENKNERLDLLIEATEAQSDPVRPNIFIGTVELGRESLSGLMKRRQ